MRKVVEVLNGTPNASASDTHRRSTGPGLHVSLLMSLVFALLLGALSALVMLPAAQHLRSLQDGERARATLHTGGACMAGHCRVEFEAGGRTVVADLPVGSGGGKTSAGTPLTVRYLAGDPRVVAREQDVGGGGAAVLAVMSGAGALFFLVLSAVAGVYLVRQRRAGRRRRASRRSEADRVDHVRYRVQEPLDVVGHAGGGEEEAEEDGDDRRPRLDGAASQQHHQDDRQQQHHRQ